VRASDVERQKATSQALLQRLASHPVQLLADEVGMGKTYVALAVASALRAPGKSCRVAVLVPNHELGDKWDREVREFNKICVTDQRLILRSPRATSNYQVNDLADLARTAPRRQLAIIRYGSHGLASRQLHDDDDRIRAAAWALSLDTKVAIHKSALRSAFGASSAGAVNRAYLADIKRLRDSTRPLLPHQLPTGKNQWLPTHIEGSCGSELWGEAVKRIRAATTRPLSALNTAVRDSLRNLARAALIAQIRTFDLVIVDEAHNWVNRANGADAARLAFLHRSRHALLLTATPLQLDAGDLPRLLGQFTDLGACVLGRPPHSLADVLSSISKRLVDASTAASRFRGAWSALPPDVDITVTSGVAAVNDARLQDAIEELTRANRALEADLGPWFVRHRRSRAHRRVLVGDELRIDYLGPEPPMIAERGVLHDAQGTDNPQAEVAQLALMRLVGLALADGPSGRRTTLAASMTGCYSTVTASKESRHLLSTRPETKPYRALIQPHIDTETRLLKGRAVRSESLHPKLQATLGVVEQLWAEGEKVLIYCWRVQTAKVVAQAIRGQLDKRTTGPEWTLLQRRLARAPLNAAASDRIVHSLCLAGRIDMPYSQLVDTTRVEATATLLGHGIPQKLLPSQLRTLHGLHQSILARAALPAADSIASVLLTACIDSAPRAESTHDRPTQAQQTVLRALLDEPALLTGAVDEAGHPEANRHMARSIDEFTQRFLNEAGSDAVAALNGRQRLVSLLTKSIQSTQTLSRLPGLVAADHPDARALADALARPMRSGGSPSPTTSMLGRLAELVSEYASIEDEQNLRLALEELDASQNRMPVDQVDGKTKQSVRKHLFDRFNGSLFPDILVCTQIGGEGIDLHRFCRVVIHYDLSFNPAKLEQRTGRCDRIGSKSERSAADLIVGIPLLAGSYDERIYETLLQRDREQEALIGSGVGGREGIAAIEEDLEDGPNEASDTNRRLRPMPPALVELLRCNYHVWTPQK